DPGQHRGGFEIVAGAVLDAWVQRRCVRQENGVQLGFFGLLRDRGVVLDAVGGGAVGAGKPPRAAEHAGVEDVDVEMQAGSHCSPYEAWASRVPGIASSSSRV